VRCNIIPLNYANNTLSNTLFLLVEMHMDPIKFMCGLHDLVESI
jgi:hypothetical protein